MRALNSSPSPRDQEKRNGVVFKYLFKNISEEQARWKPGADRWSILEVINHLYDEEREDFRKRLALVLDNPDEPWPAIDPCEFKLQVHHE
jgi:hypothetical protein